MSRNVSFARPLVLALAIATPALADDGPDRWTKRIDKDVTVTLVGISPHPSTEKSWWKPDGTPLAEAPIDTAQGLGVGNGPAFVFAFRVEGAAEGHRALASWRIASANGTGSTSPIRKGGEARDDLLMIVAGFPKPLDTTTLRGRIAAGEMRPLATSNLKGIQMQRTPAGAIAISRAHLLLRDTNLHAVINVTDTLKDHQRLYEVVDDEGRPIRPATSSSSGSNDLTLSELVFPIAPDRLREFRLLARPFVDIDFGEVSLKPRAAE